MAKDKVRVALIGANWGLTHVAAWKALPGVELVSICTSRQETAEKVASEQGIARPCWNWRELVEDESIDIIDVTVRPTIRVPMVFEALRHGKHVLQPMPFALDLAQGEELCALAAGANRTGMIESLHRFSPALRQMKAMVEAGAIGKVHTVRGHVRTGILLSPPPGYVYEWITEASSGASAIRNFGAHLLHTLTWMFGQVDEIVAQLRTNLQPLLFTDGSTKPNETFDSAQAMLRLDSGIEAAIDISWCTPGSEGFALDAIGEQGRLIVTAEGLGPQNARLRKAARGSAALEDVAIETAFERLDGAPDVRPSAADSRLFPLTAMCHNLARAAAGLETAEPQFAEALAIMRTTEAAYRSQAGRRWVRVADVRP